MIRELTGGDICYGQPVNHLGLIAMFIAMALGIFVGNLLFKYTHK